MDKPAEHIVRVQPALYGTGMSDQSQQGPSLKDLYPHLTQEELEIAEQNLERYLAVMIRIAERLKSEGKNLRDL